MNTNINYFYYELQISTTNHKQSDIRQLAILEKKRMYEVIGFLDFLIKSQYHSLTLYNYHIMPVKDNNLIATKLFNFLHKLTHLLIQKYNVPK